LPDLSQTGAVELATADSDNVNKECRLIERSDVNECDEEVNEVSSVSAAFCENVKGRTD
jgi:hypothetical protein